MSEKNLRNRKWVIKCATVFFVILLLLTFFSNTIMNYSLPKVATQYVQPGTIASKVRASGSVMPANLNNLTVNSERKVKLVAAKEGDTVDAGALLVLFEDDANSELSIAQKNLKDAKDSYDKYIVTNEVSTELVTKVESGQSGDYSGYKEQLSQASNVVKNAQKQVDDLTASAKTLQTRLDKLQNVTVDVSAEQAAVQRAQEALSDAETTLTIAQNNVSSLDERYNLYMESGEDTSSIAAELADAKGVLAAAQNNQTNCQAQLESAMAALTAKQENKENQAEITLLESQINQANAAVTEATDVLTKAQDDHQKILDEMNQEVELVSMYQAVQDAQTELDKVNANGGGNKINAPISGTVTNITITKGQTIEPGDTIMTINGSENGYQATITVTSEQARRIKVGDTAEIDESWYYTDVAGQVTAIRNNNEDPGKTKLVDIKVTGEIAEGTTLNFAIGDKNSSYNLVVPNGSIREDKNGKFVMIIRKKSSPLGNRYFAKRVNVEVVASDDVNSAINADLQGYEYIITTSTRAIAPGDQVRLTES